MKRRRFWTLVGIAVTIGAIVLVITFTRACHTGFTPQNTDGAVTQLEKGLTQLDKNVGKDLRHLSFSS